MKFKSSDKLCWLMKILSFCHRQHHRRKFEKNVFLKTTNEVFDYTHVKMIGECHNQTRLFVLIALKHIIWKLTGTLT